MPKQKLKCKKPQTISPHCLCPQSVLPGPQLRQNLLMPLWNSDSNSSSSVSLVLQMRNVVMLTSKILGTFVSALPTKTAISAQHLHLHP